jgi:hypothetical protein
VLPLVVPHLLFYDLSILWSKEDTLRLRRINWLYLLSVNAYLALFMLISTRLGRAGSARGRPALTVRAVAERGERKGNAPGARMITDAQSEFTPGIAPGAAAGIRQPYRPETLLA